MRLMTLTLAPDNAPGQPVAPAAAALGGPAGEGPSERQREVLDAVLKLMVAEGDGFSVAAVCPRRKLFEGDPLQLVWRPRRAVDRHRALAGVEGADAVSCRGPADRQSLEARSQALPKAGSP
jgi:hypothetical protein